MINSELAKLPASKMIASCLLKELEDNKLEVVLDGLPGQQNRSRVVQNSNPKWYSQIFNQHWNGKRAQHKRNGFRRDRVIKYLKNLKNGVYQPYKTYDLLMDVIRERLFEGFYDERYQVHVPPELKEQEIDEFYELINS